MPTNRKVSPIGRWMKDNLILILTTAGAVCGFAVGFGIREGNPSPDLLTWIGLPGELFIRMLKLMIIPLIVSSMIAAAASLNPKSNGRISLVSITFIVATNSLSSVVGVILALIMKPGHGVQSGDTDTTDTATIETSDIFADLLRNIMPDNIVDMAFQQSLTQNDVTYETFTRNTTNGTVNETVRKITKTVGKTPGTNVLGMIVTCMLLGLAINKAKGKGKPVLKFFTSLTDIIMIILQWLLWSTPLGVLSLIAVSTATVKDLDQNFRALGKLVGLVVIGIIIHQFIIMPIIFFVTTRRNPYKFALHIIKAWMIVFATTSPAVAIPEILSACESHQKVDRRVSRFVVPLSVTISANGSALFITSAAIFSGNITGISLNVGDIIIISILTAICVMALPSIPSSGIVTLVMILTSMNIPPDSISLLFAVDWFLDRVRSSSNLVSHAHCAVVTYHFCRNALEQSDIIQDIGKDNDNTELEV
ncbi:excitatory amino acid transporter-like [Pecten maximus]|uniref:excitatory amino acid transporter-like n=1 Tax=Pecten maximus TaxID=6579 RepID=UPI001458082E|nr:excitatory amino acid transporter-like [Pecten maximus]